jgi:hypothetical protein
LAVDAIPYSGVDTLWEFPRQEFLHAIERRRRGLDQGLHAGPEIGQPGSVGEFVPVTGRDLLEAVLGSLTGELICEENTL